MGMRLSSFIDQLFKRSTGTTDDSSHMRKTYFVPQSSATPSASHRLSKPSNAIYSSRPTVSPPKSPPPTTTTTSSSHRPTPPPQPTPTRRLATSPRSKLHTKVRDFAFTTTDDRYIGLGPTAPKASQFPRLNKKLGGSKRARPVLSTASGHIEGLPVGDEINDDGFESSDYQEEEEEEDDRPRFQFGPRFGAFFDSDDDDDEVDKKPGARGGAGSSARGGAGRSFRK